MFQYTKEEHLEEKVVHSAVVTPAPIIHQVVHHNLVPGLHLGPGLPMAPNLPLPHHPVSPLPNMFPHHHPLMPPPRVRPPLPLFSFKERSEKNTKNMKNSKYDEFGNPDDKDIMNSINKKLFAKMDPNNMNVEKIDNLVTDNFKNLLAHANNNGFNNPRDGFRKKRFSKLMDQLK